MLEILTKPIPNLDFDSEIMSRLPGIGISSHFRICQLTTLSKASFTQVMLKSAMVKFKLIFDRTYRWYSSNLFQGCNGNTSIYFIFESTSLWMSSLCRVLDIPK